MAPRPTREHRGMALKAKIKLGALSGADSLHTAAEDELNIINVMSIQTLVSPGRWQLGMHSKCTVTAAGMHNCTA